MAEELVREKGLRWSREKVGDATPSITCGNMSSTLGIKLLILHKCASTRKLKVYSLTGKPEYFK
jgi:hypothetical protein